MTKRLSRLLRREQLAFLLRDRRAWGPHLDRARAALGAGLQAADPARPVLILGAGAGLEVPWGLAPPRTTGWDADPWSRVWTALRHHRFPPWVFDDLCGGLEALAALAARTAAEPWSGRRRHPEQAIRRLAGLLPSLQPDPAALRSWVASHRPGTILAANVLGQLGVVAERVVEAGLGGAPWETDPERPDPLAEALEDWTRRALLGVMEVLLGAEAALVLVHDRAVIFHPDRVALGPWTEVWTGQVRTDEGPLEAHDPLAGVDLVALARHTGRPVTAAERWLWPVGPGQLHLVEAFMVGAARRSGCGDGQPLSPQVDAAAIMKVLWSVSDMSWLGWALAAMGFMGLANLGMRAATLRGLTPASVLLWVVLGELPLAVAYWVWRGRPVGTTTGVTWGLAAGLCTAVALILLNESFSRGAKAAVAVGFMNANVAVVALLAFLLFREQLQPMKLAGLAATLSGLWLLAR